MTHLSVRLAEKRPQDGGGPEAEDYLPYLPQAFTRNDTRGHVPTVGALDSSTKSEQARQRGGLLVSSNFDGCTKAGLHFCVRYPNSPLEEVMAVLGVLLFIVCAISVIIRFASL